ncbi:hypothetical protein HNR01_001731 [Methylorubrum rhodesianum]|jgi:hypothetical protein|uniref:recombination protein NinB n=1 Tax=Methylorubrum rhodesianum TaxID=29427 RepID=UPI0016223DDC|nr:recombination protein NinB [Methylorubrum rhodesianum]MBB5762111.1 hypothetical protein [Methylorubrum rhodesianum]
MSARHVLTLANETVRARAIRWIQGLPVGTKVEFKPPSRSLDQNAKLWACLTDVSRQVEWYGQQLTPEEWKDVFTASLRKAKVVPGLDAGSFVVLGLRTSKLTKAEFSDLIELIACFGAERGVVFSSDQLEDAA